MERKASEILLNVENQMSQLINLVNNQNLALKLISNKLAVIVSFLNKSPQPVIDFPPATEVATEQPEPEIPKSPFPGIKPGVVLNVKKSGEPTGSNRRGASRGNKDIVKKTAVVQKIVYQDGKAVGLANVDILDLDQNLLKKVRTNPAGKWATSIEPGQYFIQLFKRATTGQSDINAMYQIEVEDAEQVELEDIIIEG